MKIHHILDGISIIITNEERDFIKTHSTNVLLSSLNEHEMWTAQNLVRKGVYRITNDSKFIIVNRSSRDNRSII